MVAPRQNKIKVEAWLGNEAFFAAETKNLIYFFIFFAELQQGRQLDFVLPNVVLHHHN